MNKIIVTSYQEYIRILLFICSCRLFISFSMFNLGRLLDAKINNAFLDAELIITLKKKVKIYITGDA